MKSARGRSLDSVGARFEILSLHPPNPSCSQPDCWPSRHGLPRAGVNLQSTLRRSHRLWNDLRGSDVAIEDKRPIGIRQGCISGCVRRILLNGGLEQLYGLSFVRTVAQIQVEQATR